jgi:hypothetical protein
VAGIAAGHRIELSSHLLPEISAHLLAATPTYHYLEYVDWAGRGRNNDTVASLWTSHAPFSLRSRHSQTKLFRQHVDYMEI